MKILNELVASMTKEEVRFFKLYLTRYQTGFDRKDETYFDYMRQQGEEYDEDTILKKLYGREDKNSFFRLKNRLLTELGKNLVFQHFDEGDVSAYVQLLLAKQCLRKRLFKPAFHFLKKAEKEAEEYENYELLDIIYGDYIRLSHEVFTIDPEVFIDKRKVNLARLNELRKIDDIVALVTHKLKRSQNFSPGGENVVKMLEKVIKSHSGTGGVEDSPRLMVGTFRAVSQILIQRHDYYGLDQYVADAQNKFSGADLFNKSHPEMQLQMLTYRANALVKLKRFDEAKTIAEALYKHITSAKYNNWFAKYAFFYYNTLVNIYSETDIDRAIDLIEQMQTQTNLKQLDFYALFVPLNLAILWFGKANYRIAVRYFNELYHNEAFVKSSDDLQLKVSIAELMARYELGDFDYLTHRTKQVRKNYKEMLAQASFEREKEFVAILELLTQNPIPKNNDKLVSRVKKFVAQPEADNQVMAYNDWLKQKIK